MVGNSTEKLEPAGTRRNIRDGLKPASLTLSEESGLRVKLAPLSQLNTQLSPGTGGAVVLSPAHLNQVIQQRSNTVPEQNGSRCPAPTL